MATKTLTVIRPGTYGTRMLQAGDPLECTGPEARLFSKLGWAVEVERAEQVEKPAPRKRTRKPRKKTA